MLVNTDKQTQTTNLNSFLTLSKLRSTIKSTWQSVNIDNTHPYKWCVVSKHREAHADWSNQQFLVQVSIQIMQLATSIHLRGLGRAIHSIGVASCSVNLHEAITYRNSARICYENWVLLVFWGHHIPQIPPF